MKLSNKVYDVLKYIALYMLPAMATLVLTLGGIWHVPYAEAIAGTITAIDTFIGALIGISTKAYKDGEKED